MSDRANVIYAAYWVMGVMLGLSALGCEGEVDEFVFTGINPPGEVEAVLDAIQDRDTTVAIAPDAETWVRLMGAYLHIEPHAFTREGDTVRVPALLTISYIPEAKYAMTYDISTVRDDGNWLRGQHYWYMQAKDELQIPVGIREDAITLYVEYPSASEDMALYVTDSTQTNVRGWSIDSRSATAGTFLVGPPNDRDEVEAIKCAIRSRQWQALLAPARPFQNAEICVDLFESNTEQNTRVYYYIEEEDMILPISIGIEGSCLRSTVPRIINGDVVLFGHKGQQRYEGSHRPIAIVNSLLRLELLPIGMSDAELRTFIEEL